ncbi:MAG: hypothetical protein KJZ70_02120 [Bryobacterales bacterium]|nr:hypothetical protein [Bryobacterales bacterium]
MVRTFRSVRVAWEPGLEARYPPDSWRAAPGFGFRLHDHPERLREATQAGRSRGKGFW